MNCVKNPLTFCGLRPSARRVSNAENPSFNFSLLLQKSKNQTLAYSYSTAPQK